MKDCSKVEHTRLLCSADAQEHVTTLAPGTSLIPGDLGQQGCKALREKINQLSVENMQILSENDSSG